MMGGGLMIGFSLLVTFLPIVIIILVIICNRLR